MRATQNSEALESEEKNNNRRQNREMAVVTYIIMALFLVMAGYIIYFVVHDSDTLLNNSYNKRQDLLAKRVIKGSVLSDNGKVLARTVTDDDGDEIREYPYNGLFSHVVGRVEQGKTGLEASESYTMLTSNINPIVGMFNELQGKKNPGNNVVTTLNVKLSQVASDALGSHRGAVVVMDPETGKIVSMVSKPTYNPNNLTDSRWEKLTADSNEKSALYNRATQGLYPPGSTFKLYTALEYMREQKNYDAFSYRCTGKIGTGNNQIRCYGGEVHGTVNLSEAFATSCNTAFCTIGTQLNKRAWTQLCESFYYNREIPIRDVSQKESQFKVERALEQGDVMQAAIGQGDTLVTPLQNALLVCAAVNQGELMRPYLIDRIEDFDGNAVEEYEPDSLGNPLTKKEAKAVKSLMRGTVKHGTATSLYYGTPYKAGGKTGSAEYQNSSKDSHAWFVGYAEKDGKKLVVSVVVESAGTGSAYAVPIAKKIFDAYW